MRSIWNGMISFGLVNIPVKVYPAVEKKSISFRQLHRECHTPIRYSRHCPTCDREIEPDEIIKGYEYAKGQYVLFGEDELASLVLPSGRALEISTFVEAVEIDPIYYSKPYYLAPNQGGHKAYALLHQAMQQTGKAGLAQVTLRERESLAVLRPFGQALLMELMVYDDEVRKPEEVPDLNREIELGEKELSMAVQLINSQVEPFNPAAYQDKYRQTVQEMIQQKVAGQEVKIVPAPAAAKVIDLVEALRASIEQVDKQDKHGTRRKPATVPQRRRAGTA